MDGSAAEREAVDPVTKLEGQLEEWRVLLVLNTKSTRLLAS